MRRDDNLVDIIKETILNYWDKLALIDYTTKLSYTNKGIAEQIAKHHLLFNRCEVKEGDRIAVMGKNGSHWAITYLSILTNGSIVVPILEDFNPLDIEHILNHSETRILFCDQLLWKNLNSANLKGVQYVFSLEDFELLHSTGGETIDSTAIEEEYKRNYPLGITKDDLHYVARDPDTMISLNYTSGTTSLTKGVMLSSRNLASNITYLPLEMASRGVVLNKTVCVLPMAHAYGLAFAFLGSYIYGTEVHFLGKAPSPNLMIEVCQSVKPDILILVPLIFDKIYKYNVAPIFAKRFIKMIHEVGFLDKMLHRFIVGKIKKTLGGNLKEVVIGGAEFNSHIEKFLLKGGFPFTVGYGMTECAPLISYIRHEEFVPGSVGKILKGGFLQLRIAKNKPTDTAGEIQIKGDHVMLGYYKDEEATRATFTEDQWLKTGDKGSVDSDGNLYIKGRYKTMILGPSGENIYPEAIETKLSSLPLVGECIVIQGEKGRLEAYVYPDYPRMKLKNIKEEQMRAIMEKNRLKLNRITAKYENIAVIQILEAPLPKTPKNTIKRYGLEKYLKKN